MHTMPESLLRLTHFLWGAVLAALAACSTPPVAPLPAPETPLERPTATVDAPATTLATASIYVWSDAMATVARKLRADLPGDVANIAQSVDQRVWVSLPADAVFAAGRSALLPRATPWLDRIAALVRELPRTELQILGEADPNSRDARTANAQALDRAASARDWMVARGVAARRIAVAGRQLTALAPREARRLDIFIGERVVKLH